MGLAMVYGMVQRHSADLEIESALGSGTTARLTFPIPAAAEARTPEDTLETLAIRALRILLAQPSFQAMCALALTLTLLRDALGNWGVHYLLSTQAGQKSAPLRT